MKLDQFIHEHHDRSNLLANAIANEERIYVERLQVNIPSGSNEMQCRLARILFLRSIKVAEANHSNFVYSGYRNAQLENDGSDYRVRHAFGNGLTPTVLFDNVNFNSGEMATALNTTNSFLWDSVNAINNILQSNPTSKPNNGVDYQNSNLYVEFLESLGMELKDGEEKSFPLAERDEVMNACKDCDWWCDHSGCLGQC